MFAGKCLRMYNSNKIIVIIIIDSEKFCVTGNKVAVATILG